MSCHDTLNPTGSVPMVRGIKEKLPKVIVVIAVFSKN
jgi:hypothetical protein